MARVPYDAEVAIDVFEHEHHHFSLIGKEVQLCTRNQP